MTEKKRLLDVNALDELDSQYSTKEIDIEVEYKGETKIVSLEIDERFRPSKVRTFVENFVDRLYTVRKYNRSYIRDEVGQAYLIYMVIKHFSNFPAPQKFADEVRVIQMLIDNELLYKIYAKFNQSELEKLHDEIRDFAEKLDIEAEEFVKFAEEVGYESEYESLEESNGDLI